MSRYAYLVSMKSKKYTFLGKIVIRPTESGGEETYFHVGNDPTPNSARPLLMKVVMKFLAEHMGEEIRVMPEEVFNITVDEEFKAIGDPTLPPSWTEYAEGFPG